MELEKRLELNITTKLNKNKVNQLERHLMEEKIKDNH